MMPAPAVFFALKNRFFHRTAGPATNLSENEGDSMMVVTELPEGSYRNIISILLQRGWKSV